MTKKKIEVVYVEKKKKRKRPIFLLFVLLLIILFYVFKAFLPQMLFEMGKTMYEAKDYAVSSELFKNAYKYSPDKNQDYAYCWVRALSQQPLTYYVQKDLYKITQLDDGSKAEIYATKILKRFKHKILSKVGDSYIEEALNDTQVIRWSLYNQPIKYFIDFKANVPDYYTALVNKSFGQWQKSLDGIISFQQVNDPKSAQIYLSFVDVDSSSFCHGQNCEYSVGTTVPVIQDQKLKSMDVTINVKNNLGSYFSPEEISTVIVHEIGHALGIWGHSTYVMDIMFYSADKLYGDNSQKYISQRDINTVKLLYAFAPDVSDINMESVNRDKLFYAPIFVGDLQNGKTHGIDLASKKLKQNPNDVNNWLDLASRYTNDKQYETSNHILAQALSIARDRQTIAVIYYSMSNNSLCEKKYSEALDLAQKAQSINDDFETRALIALIKAKRGDFKSAEKEFIKLRIEQPANIDVALNMADMYIQKKDLLNARETIKSLVAENPMAAKDPRLNSYKLYTIL